MTAPQRINLAEKFSRFTDRWSPRLLGAVNDCHVKIARIEGEFIWHRHDDEDELFLVVKGRLVLRFRDSEVALGEGEMCIVPRGTDHQPVAEGEAWILLVEPSTTLNTGNIRGERTVTDLETI